MICEKCGQEVQDPESICPICEDLVCDDCVSWRYSYTDPFPHLVCKSCAAYIMAGYPDGTMYSDELGG